VLKAEIAAGETLKVDGHFRSDWGSTMFERAVAFLRESYTELRRVTWPTRKEIWGSTVVVLIVVGIIMLSIAVFDFFLTLLVRFIVR
jgi:preprotein translocase subunit SecE